MPTTYRYSPLQGDEIRAIELQPGKHSQEICFSVVHMKLTPSRTRSKSRLGLKALQRTLPAGWKVFETPEGQYFFWNGQTDEPTSFTHPDATIDRNMYESAYHVSEAGAGYEALSYTWRPEHPLDKAFIMNGTEVVSEFTIGMNLASALRGLRYTDRVRVLWIDSICINQKDISERDYQVKRMGHIYSFASRVVVWLGPSSHDSKLAMDTISYLGRQVEVTTTRWKFCAANAAEKKWFDQDCLLPFTTEQWAAIDSLLDRVWFTRLWTVQEISLGQENAIICCGADTIRFHDFRRALGALRGRKGAPARLTTHVDRSRGIIFGHQFLDILQLGSTIAKLDCSDPRDKIYGVLSLMSESLQSSIQPSYASNAVDVYVDFVLKNAFQSERLDLLLQAWMSDEPSVGPSWVPQWGTGRLPSFIMNYIYQASGMSKGSAIFEKPNMLHVVGVEVACVSSVKTLRGHLHPFRELYENLRETMDETYPTGGSNLDALIRTLVLDELEDRDRNLAFPTFAASKAAAMDHLKHVADTVEEGSATTPTISRIERIFASASFLQTEEGYYAVANLLTKPGDRVCVVLGAWLPVVLRPLADGRYRVVGRCYIHGAMDSQTILGQLPQDFVVYQERINSACRPRYRNTQTGDYSAEDPRLENLPKEWKRVDELEAEYSKEHPIFADWFENAHTGERINYDPRLTASEVAKRCSKLRDFCLV